MLNLFLESQIYVLFMFFIMITMGIIKNENLFSSLFSYINVKTKSKRMTLFFISLFGGILPISGRVAVSANMIYSLTPNCDTRECRKSKSKLGIIDYISSHHYYLWSPLEKTIIIPMAILGLSYLKVMSYLWPLLLITSLYILWFIFVKIKEEDILINLNEYKNYSLINIIKNILPFLLSIILLILDFNGTIIFSLLSLYYIVITKNFNIKKLFSYINWKVLLIISIVTLLGKYSELYSDEITNIIQNTNVLGNIYIKLFVASSLMFVGAFILGSSSKFSGWVSVMTLIFGMKYFVWFFNYSCYFFKNIRISIIFSCITFLINHY